MWRAIVDTNILIRGVIMPNGTVGPVITRLRDGDYTLVYSAPLIDELLEKLALPRIREKYHLNDQDIDDLLALIALRGELVTPTRKVKICRDPKDDMFIEAALAGNAEVIVTGDEDLLTLKEFETVRFVTPRAFLALLDQRQQAEK
jgi:putative PIN family toxin of toxin-antitoxin system